MSLYHLDNEPGLIKLCQFPGVDPNGNKLIEIFHDPDQLHHSYMDKVAAPFLPQVREYIDQLKPDRNSIYALVNALGAYEYWSSNINGDGFEEEHLIHRGPVWGYDTFLHYARPYMHHCFRAGTEVVMGDRSRKPIALVKAGDLVETRKGPRRVKDAMKRPYRGPGVKLSMSGVADDLEASWDHPVFIYKREVLHCSHRYSRIDQDRAHFEEYPSCVQDIGLPQEVQLGTVLPGDYMVSPRPKLGGVPVPLELAELVGWVASEGYCAGKRGMIQFTFCEFNYEDIASVHACLEANGVHVCRTELPDKEQVVLSSWSVDLWDTLQKYVVGVKSEKCLTKGVMAWDVPSLKVMLGAYIDGDGHIPEKGQNEGQLRIRSSSAQMLRILSDIIRAMSVPTTIQWDAEPGFRTFPHGKAYWCSGSGTVTVTPQFSPEVSESSRKHHVRDMKKLHPRSLIGDFFLVRVVGREDTELEESLYNLEVEDIPEYVAGEVLVHNCNKGPNARAFGAVELSCWHDCMKRVELVVRLDRADAEKVGAHKVIDKIDHGQLPDTSMGCKVPYDLCSITTDWDLYRKALQGFNPKTDRHPGMAVLRYHKNVRPIPGVSITKNDYSDFLKYRMNEILPDGRKVCAFNPFPRFFDISFVFIGADKTSKMMAKLAGKSQVVVPSSYIAECYGYGCHIEQPGTHKDFEVEKVASLEGAREMLRSFKKRASQRKRAEITKDVVPSQFGSKAIPILEDSEKELPNDVLDQMGDCPLREALSTPTMMGITLKPREFQRITLRGMGRGRMAEELDDAGRVFGPTDDVDKSTPLGGDFISSLISRLLKGSVEDRSAFGPPLQRRMIRITISGRPQHECSDLVESKDDLLDKLSAAYNGYREQVIEKIADISQQLHRFPEARAAVFGKTDADIFVGHVKEAAGINPKLLLGAIPATYLMSALARHKVRNSAARGQETGLFTEMLADHPHLAATAVGIAALKATGSNLPDHLLKGAISIGKRVAGLG